MAAMSSAASRSASRRACSWPSAWSSGSPCPSTIGNGSPERDGADSPCRTSSTSAAPGGRRNWIWRYSVGSPASAIGVIKVHRPAGSWVFRQTRAPTYGAEH